MDKKLMVIISIGIIVMIFIGAALLSFLGESMVNYDVHSPAIYFTGTNNIAILYKVQVHGSMEPDKYDAVVSIYSRNGEIISGPRKIATLYESLKEPGIYVPYPQAKVVLDSDLNAYIVQARLTKNDVFNQYPFFTVVDHRGNKVIDGKKITLDPRKTKLNVSEVEVYPRAIIVDDEYVHLFILLYEEYNKWELHYFKYTHYGDLVIEDTPVPYMNSSSQPYTRSPYNRIIEINGKIYLIFDRYKKALVINADAGYFKYFMVEPDIVAIKVKEKITATQNITYWYRFINVYGSYYPLSSAAVIEGNTAYVFDATLGGCVGPPPHLKVSKYVNWSEVVDKKTIYTARKSNIEYCYNPDIFGINAKIGPDGRIYFVWYENDGCNRFFGYFLVLKDTDVVVGPIKIETSHFTILPSPLTSDLPDFRIFIAQFTVIFSSLCARPCPRQ